MLKLIGVLLIVAAMIVLAMVGAVRLLIAIGVLDKSEWK